MEERDDTAGWMLIHPHTDCMATPGVNQARLCRRQGSNTTFQCKDQMIQGIEQQIKRIMDYTATQKMPKAIRRSIIQQLPLQPAERTTLSHKTIRKALTQDVRSKMNPRQGQTGDVQVIKNNSKGERVTVFVPPTLMFTSIQAHAWRHQRQITTKHHKRVIRSRE